MAGLTLRSGLARFHVTKYKDIRSIEVKKSEFKRCEKFKGVDGESIF